MRRVLFWVFATALGLVAVAVALFFRPDLTRKELQEYVSNESRFLELPMGATAHYRDEGNLEGAPIVLLHGGFGSLHNWEAWAPFLEDRFRLISLDLPAHGLTGPVEGELYTRAHMVRFVRELLDALNVERATLAGHSMGGGVALAFALQYPSSVSALILVGSEGVPPEGGYDFEDTFFEDQTRQQRTLQDKALSPVEFAFTKLGSPWAVRKALESMVSNKSLVTSELVERFGRILRHEGNRRAIVLMFRQGLASMDTKEDLAPRMGEIEVPVLVMSGNDDALVPPAVNDRFHDLLRDSELRRYPTGHMIMLEAPEETTTDLARFLTERRVAQ